MTMEELKNVLPDLKVVQYTALLPDGKQSSHFTIEEMLPDGRRTQVLSGVYSSREDAQAALDGVRRDAMAAPNYNPPRRPIYLDIGEVWVIAEALAEHHSTPKERELYKNFRDTFAGADDPNYLPPDYSPVTPTDLPDDYEDMQADAHMAPGGHVVGITAELTPHEQEIIRDALEGYQARTDMPELDGLVGRFQSTPAEINARRVEDGLPPLALTMPEIMEGFRVTQVPLGFEGAQEGWLVTNVAGEVHAVYSTKQAAQEAVAEIAAVLLEGVENGAINPRELDPHYHYSMAKPIEPGFQITDVPMDGVGGHEWGYLVTSEDGIYAVYPTREDAVGAITPHGEGAHLGTAAARGARMAEAPPVAAARARRAMEEAAIEGDVHRDFPDSQIEMMIARYEANAREYREKEEEARSGGPFQEQNAAHYAQVAAEYEAGAAELEASLEARRAATPPWEQPGSLSPVDALRQKLFNTPGEDLYHERKAAREGDPELQRRLDRAKSQADIEQTWDDYGLGELDYAARLGVDPEVVARARRAVAEAGTAQPPKGKGRRGAGRRGRGKYKTKPDGSVEYIPPEIVVEGNGEGR